MTQTMRSRLIDAAEKVSLRSIVHRDGDMRSANLGEDSAAAIVDAILEAVREPGEAMIYEGQAVNDMGDPHDNPPTRYEVERAFTAMIDAIRSDAAK